MVVVVVVVREEDIFSIQDDTCILVQVLDTFRPSRPLAPSTSQLMVVVVVVPVSCDHGICHLLQRLRKHKYLR
jgi:hypothetical protein